MPGLLVFALRESRTAVVRAEIFRAEIFYDARKLAEKLVLYVDNVPQRLKPE